MNGGPLYLSNCTSKEMALTKPVAPLQRSVCCQGFDMKVTFGVFVISPFCSERSNCQSFLSKFSSVVLLC